MGNEGPVRCRGRAEIPSPSEGEGCPLARVWVECYEGLNIVILNLFQNRYRSRKSPPSANSQPAIIAALSITTTTQ